MDFKEEFTTNEKIAIDEAKPKEKQTGEKDKTILSNDAYGISKQLSNLEHKLNILIGVIPK
jgi:hypothetical protein